MIAACLLGALLEFLTQFTGQRLLGFSISFFPYYVGMGMCGAYFYAKNNEQNSRCFLLAGYLLCSIGTICLTYMDSYRIGQGSERFLEYQSPLTIIGTICVFRFFVQLRPEILSPFRKHISALAKTTFGVYLLHPLVLDLLSNSHFAVQLKWNTFSPVIWIPTYSASIFLFCVLCVWIYKKAASKFMYLVNESRK